MKQNFTNEEIGKIVINLTSAIAVTIKVNRAGNIDVRNPKTFEKEKWTLYNTPDGYLWRRHNLKNGYCYPLHMVNRNDLEVYMGNYSYRYWNMHKHCGFKTIDEALEYFIPYFKKHDAEYEFPTYRGWWR